MIHNFYMNDYCEVQQPDGQWYRGTIQGGPYVGDNGSAYYKVHIHHPLNKHEMIWATSIRPSSDGYPYQPSFRPTSLPLASYSSSTNIVNMPVANQFAAHTSQPMGWKNCLAGLFTPSAVPTQSVVPLKRPLDASHQLVALNVKAETVTPAHSYTNANVATSAVAAVAEPAVVAEPAAKRPALQRAYNTTTTQTSTNGDATALPIRERPPLVHLEGPVIEVHVSHPSLHGLPEGRKTWGLPKALLAHFSPFFKAATRNGTDATSRASIELTGFHTTAFAMFVEWMYWGCYKTQSGVLDTDDTTDVNAWILGDKLKTADFQNLAMTRLYSQHAGSSSHRILTIDTVAYVCAKTETGSPLRLFHFDVLAQNFTNHARVKGSLEEWDMALQEYPDARLVLLGSFRTYGSPNSLIKARESYLIKADDVRLNRVSRSATQLGAPGSAEVLRANVQDTPRIKPEVNEEPEEF